VFVFTEGEISSDWLSMPRKVWICPATPSEDCFVFLDGELYTDRVKAPEIVRSATCIYLRNVSAASRHADYTCNENFASFIAEVPHWIEQHVLVPTVDSATDVLHDLNGTVLDRINGPILGTLLSEWHGQWPKYPNGGGNGNTFYQELGYMFAHIDQAVQYQNATAHLLGFQAGAGSTSIYGDGMTAQQLQDLLSEGYGPPHRKPVTPLLPGVPGLAAPDPGVPSPTVAVPDLPTLTEGPGR